MEEALIVVVAEVGKSNRPPPTNKVDEAFRLPTTFKEEEMDEEAVETNPPKEARPVPVMTSAVMSEVPMEMLPKPEPKAPEVSVPTVTRFAEPAQAESAVFSTRSSLSVDFRLAVEVAAKDVVESA